MAHLSADRYVSVENGNDGNDGSTEALAWATVDKAATNAVAGETVAIAPGTYREVITVDNAGTSGNEIKFMGDPKCLYFDNENPGRVRITDTNASEEGQGSAELIASKQNYVEWYNLHLDILSEAIDFGSDWDADRIIYDSTIYGSVMKGTAVRCVVLQGNSGPFPSRSIIKQCIVIGAHGFSGCVQAKAYNTLIIGSQYGFHLNDNVSSLAHNCVALSCNYGFINPQAAGAITSCYAIQSNKVAANITAGEAVNCYYAYCAAVNDADFGSEGSVALHDLSVLREMLPWVALSVAGNLLRQGDNTGPAFGATDTDISEHRLRLKDKDLDIGPWSISEEADHPFAAGDPGLLDWATFYATMPSVRIESIGDYILSVPAKAGQQITVNCWVRHNGIGSSSSSSSSSSSFSSSSSSMSSSSSSSESSSSSSFSSSSQSSSSSSSSSLSSSSSSSAAARGNPQLILEGDGIATQIATSTAADNVWQQLTVSATPAINEVLTIIFRGRDVFGVSYFSDLSVA